jgi:hypothetical protein
MKNFNDVISGEIRKSIPDDWKMIDGDKLEGKEPYKIRYAFNSSIIDGKSQLINILVLNKDIILNELIENLIFNLKNSIISKDGILIVICEQENSDYTDDLKYFISEMIDYESQNFYSIFCYSDNDFKTTINGETFEDLNLIINDIWSGNLRFSGPKTGIQKVNIELITDKCWKCNKPMKTVSGIVFPNKQSENWDNYDWLYYNQLVPVSALNSVQAESIKGFVDKLRIKDNSITPVEYRYSNTSKSKYWAAGCPYCNSLRGNFYVAEYRMEYLHDLESRINKDLQYYTVELNVGINLIEALNDGYDLCPHTCFTGWERK